MSTKTAEKCIQTGSFNIGFVRSLLRTHSRPIFGLGEGAINMLHYRALTGKTSIIAPVGIGFVAKRVSPTMSHDSFPFNLLGWAKYLPI